MIKYIKKIRASWNIPSGENVSMIDKMFDFSLQVKLEIIIKKKKFKWVRGQKVISDVDWFTSIYYAVRLGNSHQNLWNTSLSTQKKKKKKTCGVQKTCYSS